jgi:hypothetical protein
MAFYKHDYTETMPFWTSVYPTSSALDLAISLNDQISKMSWQPIYGHLKTLMGTALVSDTWQNVAFERSAFRLRI